MGRNDIPEHRLQVGSLPQMHVSVRIHPSGYLTLKAYFLDLATNRSVEKPTAEFQRIPFEPYAPVRRQLLNILRAVNRERTVAGYDLVPVEALRLCRRIVSPFVCEVGRGRPSRDRSA